MTNTQNADVPPIGAQVRIGNGKAIWTVVNYDRWGSVQVNRPSGQYRMVRRDLLVPVT